MAYQQNIPLSSDALRNSQGDLQGNFQALNTWMNVNHYLPNTANSGKHKFITLPVQSPAPAFAAGETGLYTFLNPQLNTNQMYVNLQNGTKIPMTAASLMTPGWTYLPSGLLMKWGQVSATGGQLVNFPVGAGIPVFAGMISVNLTLFNNADLDPNRAVTLTAYNATQFRVYCSFRTSTGAATASFTYIALGL